MTKPTLLVLAAGIGSRYGGFKQIDPVGPTDETVLDYSVYDAWRAGFGKVVFVIREEIEAPVREHFDPRLKGRLEVDYVYQHLDDLPDGFSLPTDREKPWGTGHAIRAARDAVKEPFAVINADDFYGTGSYETMAGFLSTAASTRDAAATFCMVAFRLRNALSAFGSVSRGICSVDPEGFLSDVVERTKIELQANGDVRFLDEQGQWAPLTGEEPASMNMWGFTPRLFDFIEELFREFLTTRIDEPKSEFFIPTVVDTLIKAGACRTAVLTTDEKWFGMTYREDRDKVKGSIRALIESNVYPAALWSD
ncbi:MAG: NTP transferase domain-containing protein [Lentisphaerae bacterium]|jgi:hypothetical protein|nr:NTP transferase domain-containing protein [Lentisphaerota bacterium]MBT4820200.1 NTP transferase domain-containing protein [Lentisphaerota bacterium]MBT5607274.1 NTP transferase domain-containing protein [Lentisphaerota bacterium]MBT7058797.1 NTP transferase domain-containing protein [Lentisphaerota bacterium]MBT7842393.1 NTP transferase domain-containing protein [Lentisphaerota bacterium]